MRKPKVKTMNFGVAVNQVNKPKPLTIPDVMELWSKAHQRIDAIEGNESTLFLSDQKQSLALQKVDTRLKVVENALEFENRQAIFRTMRLGGMLQGLALACLAFALYRYLSD